MGYREQRDGMQQRIAELEAELRSAKVTIRRMQGKDEGHETEKGYSLLAGSPNGYSYEQHIDCGLSEKSYNLVEELLAERMPDGAISRTGRVLRYTRQNEEVVISPADEGTSIVGNAYLEGRGFSFFFIGTFILIFVTNIAFIPGSIAGWGAPWFAVSLLTGLMAAYFGVRGILSRSYRKSRKRLTSLVETIEQIAREQTDPPLRIDISDAADADAAAVEEAALEEAAMAEAAEATA